MHGGIETPQEKKIHGDKQKYEYEGEKIRITKKKVARTIPNTKNKVEEVIGKLPRVSGDTTEIEIEVLPELSTDNEGKEGPSRAVDSKSLSKK